MTAAQKKALIAIEAGQTATGNAAYAKMHHTMVSNLRRAGYTAADQNGRVYLTENGKEALK